MYTGTAHVTSIDSAQQFVQRLPHLSKRNQHFMPQLRVCDIGPRKQNLRTLAHWDEVGYGGSQEDRVHAQLFARRVLGTEDWKRFGMGYCCRSGWDKSATDVPC